MGPRFKLDEIGKKSKAELMAELQELKAKLKKDNEERSLPAAKVLTDGDPNKLSEMEKLCSFLAEESRKQKAELREADSNRELQPLILRLKSQEHPCCTAASPPAFSEDGEGKEA